MNRDAAAAAAAPPGQPPSTGAGRIACVLVLRAPTDAQLEEALRGAYAAARRGPFGLLLAGGDLWLSAPDDAAAAAAGGPGHHGLLQELADEWRARLAGMITAPAVALRGAAIECAGGTLGTAILDRAPRSAEPQGRRGPAQARPGPASPLSTPANADAGADPEPGTIGA
jgi:hypothetical protein